MPKNHPYWQLFQFRPLALGGLKRGGLGGWSNGRLCRELTPQSPLCGALIPGEGGRTAGDLWNASGVRLVNHGNSDPLIAILNSTGCLFGSREFNHLHGLTVAVCKEGLGILDVKPFDQSLKPGCFGLGVFGFEPAANLLA